MMKGNMLEQIMSPEDIRAMSVEELYALCDEARQRLLKVTFNNGGHLASNLGAVELTVALHYVFDTPNDKLLWDVGHQCYTHKLLTGRARSMDTIRRKDGISGFPKITESLYDTFGTGHASTSLSAALGMACARDLKGERYEIIPVIGDGALTGGMALEALNNIGQRRTRMIIILNDNGMSINKNVGAITDMLSRLRTKKAYLRAKMNTKRILRRSGELIRRIERIKNSIKYLFVGGVWFEELGIKYIGPVDGHDLGRLIHKLRQAREYEGPVIVHVHTKKGHGYSPAELQPELYHGVSCAGAAASGETFASVFGDTLKSMADSDPRICALSAAMPESCGLAQLVKAHPARVFDFGITEENCATAAGGMAASGLRPVFAVYSTFLQRAYDNIIEDMAMQELPVLLAVMSTGIAGEDGETHQGVFTNSYLLHIPNLRVYAPVFRDDIEAMMKDAIESAGPSALLIPKGAPLSGGLAFTGGIRAHTQRSGAKVLLLACGARMCGEALKAAQMLSAHGVVCDVADACVVKPLDTAYLQSAAQRYAFIYTLEDNLISGGFGSEVALCLANAPCALGFIGVDDRYVKQGSIEQCLVAEGMDAEAIAERILRDSGKA